ncbi:MAG: DUF4145 domain-containing protein [Verrucomicrobia bacterium]|jgi:type I restriction enzyme R subunit|nr:DUF4145 domain-containing protein [Verrucomicrobiota bacterium]
MRTNFDFLLQEPRFETFAEAAVSAERVLSISPALCATACRTALEFAVKWVYSVDDTLSRPYEETLAALIHTNDFRDMVPQGLFPKINSPISSSRSKPKKYCSNNPFQNWNETINH